MAIESAMAASLKVELIKGRHLPASFADISTAAYSGLKE